MTPEELKPIILAWGGVEKFAALIQVKPRTVNSWLLEQRGIKPPIVMLILSLKPTETKEARP